MFIKRKGKATNVSVVRLRIRVKVVAVTKRKKAHVGRELFFENFQKKMKLFWILCRLTIQKEKF